MGIHLTNDYFLYMLHFAEDQVLVADDKDVLEYMIRKLAEEYKTWELQVNMRKTKYMCVVGEPELTHENIKMD